MSDGHFLSPGLFANEISDLYLQYHRIWRNWYMTYRVYCHVYTHIYIYYICLYYLVPHAIHHIIYTQIVHTVYNISQQGTVCDELEKMPCSILGSWERMWTWARSGDSKSWYLCLGLLYFKSHSKQGCFSHFLCRREPDASNTAAGAEILLKGDRMVLQRSTVYVDGKPVQQLQELRWALRQFSSNVYFHQYPQSLCWQLKNSANIWSAASTGLGL